MGPAGATPLPADGYNPRHAPPHQRPARPYVCRCTRQPARGRAETRSLCTTSHARSL